MIRKARPNESNEVLNLIARTFPNSAIVKRGDGELKRDLETGKYVSYIALKSKRIVGHAGVQIINNCGIFGGFIVDQSYRGEGVGRRLFDTRMEDAEQDNSIDRIVSYVSLRQSISQRLYDERFFPLGLSLSVNPYSVNEGEFKKGRYSLELVLGWNKKGGFKIKTPYSEFYDQMRRLYSSIGGNLEIKTLDEDNEMPIVEEKPVVINIKDCNGEELRKLYEKGFTFLGILPSGKDGLDTIGFVSPKKLGEIKVDSIFYISGDERTRFVNQILNHQIF